MTESFPAGLFDHQDSLEALNHEDSVENKLAYVHHVVNQQYPFIQRIAVAVYEPRTGLLKTFTHSSQGEEPLNLYQARLKDAPMLSAIVDKGRPRVINNLDLFQRNPREHTQRIRGQGYRASYTMPLYHNGEFFGFIFFNSNQADVFSERVLHYLDLIGRVLSLSVSQELSCWRFLSGALATLQDVTRHRDPETGAHLARMAHYSRILARYTAPRFQFSDEQVEQIFAFAPLHDIGKIGIPDEILLKPGRLTTEEFTAMKQHTVKGREIVDTLIRQFGVGRLDGTEILCNIVELHHETLDGKGYPRGLRGEEIPPEARIVTVADIFDALTSVRPYKPAWDNETALTELRRLADARKLDRDCVDVLHDHFPEFVEIQQGFREEGMDD